MKKQAQYISSIEINALWKGGRHIKWKLRPDVNILSGINGVGKSTIINHAVRGLHLIDSGELKPGEIGNGITITLSPDDATSIRYDVIRSFDRPLLHSDLLEKLADSRVKTELDWYEMISNFGFDLHFSNKEYMKAVYCHPACLTYLQSTS